MDKTYTFENGAVVKVGDIIFLSYEDSDQYCVEFITDDFVVIKNMTTTRHSTIRRCDEVTFNKSEGYKLFLNEQLRRHLHDECAYTNQINAATRNLFRVASKIREINEELSKLNL